VAEYIQRTEEILGQVWEVVQESESRLARQVFAKAQELHRISQKWLQTRPRTAQNASREAREAARHAARIARNDLGRDERARVRLEYLRERLDLTLERAREARNERALRFLGEAERQLHRAGEQHGQRNFEMALNLLDAVEALLGRAARLLLEGGDARHVEREFDRTWDFWERTREQLGDAAPPPVRELLAQAKDRLGQASEALARGEPWRALRLLRQARHLTGRAASSVEAGPSEEAVRDQIERWEARVEDVAAAVDSSGHQKARLTLARSRRYRERAEELLAEPDRVEALRQIKIAHDLLQEASELAR
jgi:hypothetical protein